MLKTHTEGGLYREPLRVEWKRPKKSFLFWKETEKVFDFVLRGRMKVWHVLCFSENSAVPFDSPVKDALHVPRVV